MTLKTGEARIMCFDETIILIFSASPAGAVSFENSRLRFLLLLLGGPAALLGEPSVASLPIPSVVCGLAAFVVAVGFERTRTKSPSGSKVYRVEGIAKPWRLTQSEFPFALIDSAAASYHSRFRGLRALWAAEIAVSI